MEVNKIYQGDCLEVMKTFPDNYFDSIVTDPPYGIGFMGKGWDTFKSDFISEATKNHLPIDNKKQRERGGAMHAGEYDLSLSGNQKFQQWFYEISLEMLRVLKPGGHLLSFCGCRTYHRMASAIEDAGFEIRDQMQWLFGSGFPKSLDISKAIDKQFGAEREVIGEKIYGDGKPCHPVSAEAMLESAGKSQTGRTTHNPLTEPSTDEAKQWSGWGTALKPANEPICVARKPLSEKTVASNVLKHGTGGINIDACRIETDPAVDDMLRIVTRGKRESETWEEGSGFKNENNNLTGVPANGRFPSNVILDEVSAAMLDEQTGTLTSGMMNAGQKRTQGGGYHGGFPNEATERDTYGDSGGASRFFYCAKTSKSERNKGLEKFAEKITDADYRPNDDGKNGLVSRLHGATSKGHNNHPTVKPLDLMRYLVKLVTPPKGIVLDPFGGSGTTGIACKLERMNYVLIEKEVEYITISEARIAAWHPENDQTKLEFK